MSISIYTYHNPYKLNSITELYSDQISKGENTTKENTDGNYVALYNERLSSNGNYHMILHPTLVEGKKEENKNGIKGFNTKSISISRHS